MRALVLALGLTAAGAAGLAPAGPSAGEAPAVSVEGRWGAEAFDDGEYFSADELATWRAFRSQRRLLALARLPVRLAFFLLFLVGPLGPAVVRATRRLARALARRAPFRGPALRRLGGALGRLFGEDWAGALLFAYAFMLGGLLVSLPFDLWGEALNQRAGLSNYTAGSWIWDLVKAQLLSAAVLSFLVFGLFGLVRRMPRRWWLALGVPTAVLLAVWGLVSPYRARVFHDFRPLDDPALVAHLEGLAEREGFELSAVKVVNASRTTNALDAYVTGIGPSRELVLFDTLVKAMTPAEIEVAFAHELGHLRNENLPLRSALAGLGLLALLWFLARVLRWGGTRFGLEGPGDYRALALLFLAGSLVLLPLGPLQNAWSRHEERRADRVALTLTGNPEAFVTLQTKLARVNRADVDPPRWAVVWFAGHPSVHERIATARWYRSRLRELARRGR